MVKSLFADWLNHAVVLRKQEHNPNNFSLDNHGSRFSISAIDVCETNKLDMLCYPGHLTHLLQGPDVALGKPISTVVDSMIQNNPVISGNSDLTCFAFMSIDYAVKSVCTLEMVRKAFMWYRVKHILLLCFSKF